MSSLVLLYRANIELICEQLWTLNGRTLTKLLALGLFDGASSWRLFRSYREWGILHLLVLSGSQFYAFARAWELICLFIQRAVCGKSSPTLARFALAPASLIFLETLGFSAPLVRCALLYGLAATFAPAGFSLKACYALAFVAHILIIENANPSDSAYLSWLAFLTLITAKYFFRHALTQALFVTAALQLALCLLRDQPLELRTLLIALICNSIALPYYEKIVFPFVGFVSALALLLSVIWIPSISTCILTYFVAPASALILDLLLFPLLVAHTAFGYTFAE